MRDHRILGPGDGRLEIRDLVKGQRRGFRMQLPASGTMGDAVHPRPHRGGIAERPQAGPGLEERLLYEVLGGGPVPSQQQEVVEDPRSQLVVQLGESPLISVARRIYQPADIRAGRQGVGARHGL